MSILGIGIVTYNRLAYLKKVIKQVRLLTSEPYEIVVADDGSSDGTVSYLESIGVRYVTGPNRGVCWNKNRALAALEGMKCDPILLLEDDCFPVDKNWDLDWRRATELWHHVCYAHPKLQPQVISGTGTPEDPYVNQKSTAQCSSASLLLLEKIGYFDTRFQGYGVGHAEWTTRAKRAGYGFKQVALSSGRIARANLFIPGGLQADDAPTFKDRANIRRNEELFDRIKKESLYRFPWQNEKEREDLRKEFQEAKFSNAIFDRERPSLPVASREDGAAGADISGALLVPNSAPAPTTNDTEKGLAAQKRDGLNVQSYWDRRYATGGTSGPGSIRELARYKNRFLNRFVLRTKSHSIIELGCGDGLQLRNARYPEYTGLDISVEAVNRCKALYAKDKFKHFYTIDKANQVPDSDVCLSLDVIYHILDDVDYWQHLKTLFGKSKHFVIIYGNDTTFDYRARHIKLRDFVGDIAAHFSDWTLSEFHRNPYYSDDGSDPTRTWANFFIFERRSEPVFIARRPEREANVGDPNVAPFVAAIADIHRYILRTYPWILTNITQSATSTTSSSQDTAYSLPIVEAATLDSVIISAARAETVFVVERSTESIVQMMDLEQKFLCKDLSGTVRDANLRRKFLFLIKSPRPRIVVSLTTISSRLESLGKVLRTICDQTIVPDAIILNLSKDAYLLDDGVSEESIPADVTALVRSSMVEVNWVKNTGPYRKLVDTVAKFRDSNTIVVTVDDDVLLPRDWLFLLLREYQRTGCSISFRSRVMTEANGVIGPYRDWRLINTETTPDPGNPLLLATGKLGVLYHVSFFGDALFDKEFQDCAPGADDLFYKVCLALTGVNTVNVSLDDVDKILYSAVFGSVRSDGPALWDTNKKLNDSKLKLLIEYGRKKYDLVLGNGGRRGGAEA